MAGLTMPRLQKLIAGFTGRVAVETGTFEADTTRLLLQVFTVVHTIELEPVWFERCRDLLRDTHAVCHQGNSALLLPEICRKYGDDPIFFYPSRGSSPQEKASSRITGWGACTATPLRSRRRIGWIGFARAIRLSRVGQGILPRFNIQAAKHDSDVNRAHPIGGTFSGGERAWALACGYKDW